MRRIRTLCDALPWVRVDLHTHCEDHARIAEFVDRIEWSPEAIDAYRRHDPGGIVCGIEAVHGHQGYAAGARWDLEAYPGCAVGGFADIVRDEHTGFGLFANSDLHVHKQGWQFDYGPGVFSHTLVGVASQRSERPAPGPQGPRGPFTSVIRLQS